MPVDFEMLLSVSPPLYAYSAFTDCRFSHIKNDNAFPNNDSFEFSKRNFINAQRLQQCIRYPDYHSDGFISCGKEEDTCAAVEYSCENDVSGEESLPTCKSEKKKRVSFADDKGLSLVDVRLIPECTDSIAYEPDNLLSLLTAGVNPGATCEKKWKPSFEYPPFEAKVLREKLDKALISLESVRFSEDNDEVLNGTIKVKNVAFEKDVFLRFTFDRWVSHTDVPAYYVPVEVGDGTSEKYDTFKFSVEIPYSAFRYQVVEFCACLKSNGVERWDNNGGINYRLVATQNDQRNGNVPKPSQRKYSVFTPPQIKDSAFDIECGYGHAGLNYFPNDGNYW